MLLSVEPVLYVCSGNESSPSVSSEAFIYPLKSNMGIHNRQVQLNYMLHLMQRVLHNIQKWIVTHLVLAKRECSLFFIETDALACRHIITMAIIKNITFN